MQQLNSEKLMVKIPQDIICPITHQIMTEPVILIESGNTYEQEAILEWLQKNNSDPLTNEKISNTNIMLNKTIKRLIINFIDEHKKMNPDIIYEIYLPKSLIQKLTLAIQKNNTDIFIEALEQDRRLLTEDLKNSKNLLTLSCESASLEILNIVLDKLGDKIKDLPCIQKDNGLALFLMVSSRLGLKGAECLAKAINWQYSDLQKSLITAVQNNDIETAKIVLQLGEGTLKENIMTPKSNIAQFSIFNNSRLSRLNQINVEQQDKQNKLVNALLSGNIELSIALAGKQDELFLYPNKYGLFPLVAAVYSTNLKLVKYVEEKLNNDEALKQWEKVDTNMAINNINTKISQKLSEGYNFNSMKMGIAVGFLIGTCWLLLETILGARERWNKADLDYNSELTTNQNTMVNGYHPRTGHHGQHYLSSLCNPNPPVHGYDINFARGLIAVSVVALYLLMPIIKKMINCIDVNKDKNSATPFQEEMNNFKAYVELKTRQSQNVQKLF